MQAKLRCSAFAALLIAAGTALPHIWQVLRDYGLPAMGAPACSIRQFGLIPRAVTLSDVFLFWFLCRFACAWGGPCFGLAIGWEKCCLRCLLAHQPSACLHCYAFPV